MTSVRRRDRDLLLIVGCLLVVAYSLIAGAALAVSLLDGATLGRTLSAVAYFVLSGMPALVVVVLYLRTQGEQRARVLLSVRWGALLAIVVFPILIIGPWFW